MTDHTITETIPEFDRRGFNKDGIHRVTGTIFNTRARTRAGETPRQYGERVVAEAGVSKAGNDWRIEVANAALSAGLRPGLRFQVSREAEGDGLKLTIDNGYMPMTMELWVGEGEELLFGAERVRLIPTIDSVVEGYTRKSTRKRR